MICNKCGQPVPDGDRFCTHCGNDLEIQREETAALASKPTCPHCGAPMNEGDLFCMTCGKRASDPVQTPDEEPETQDISAEEVVSQEENAVIDESPTEEVETVEAELVEEDEPEEEIPNPETEFPPVETLVPEQPAAEMPRNEKKKRNRTPLLIGIIVLLVAAIAVGVTYLVMSRSGSSDLESVPSASVSQAEESTEEYLDPNYLNRDTGAAYESDLQDKGMEIIANTREEDDWRNPNLMDSVSVSDTAWVGNNYIVIYQVFFDWDEAYNVKKKYHNSYYAYVIFRDPFLKDDGIHFMDFTRTEYHSLNMYDSTTDGDHPVNGYATSDEAMTAAKQLV